MLDFPVVSGNVSLYNETEGRPIQPTPAIGGLGVLDDATRAIGLAMKPWLDIVLIGETKGWLGQSLWLREVAGREEGAPPPVDLAAERRNGDFVRARIEAGEVRACHDVSDGGLLVAVAEMALKGNIGADIGQAALADAIPFFFGEDQARYLIAAPFAEAEKIVQEARDAYIPVTELGKTGGDAITVNDKDRVTLSKLRDAHEGWFPRFMGREEIPLTN